MLEKRLKNLRSSLENTAFQQLNFSETNQKQIHEKIMKSNENKEDLLLAILQLLMTKRTGYELNQLLQVRGIKQFEENEGFLYTVLHRFEQAKLIRSNWDDIGEKYYYLDEKGRKMIRKTEKSPSKIPLIYNELLRGE